MTRRRLAVLAAGIFGVVGLTLIPAPGSASPSKDSGTPAAQSNSKGNGPKGERCDPQPTKGNGPPPGKGTKKCASR